MKDVFRSGDSSKKFKIAEGQWYRYAPSYVSPAYHLLEGFPFIHEPPSGDLQERVLIRHHDYDQCFQSVQLLQWNSQVKFNTLLNVTLIILTLSVSRLLNLLLRLVAFLHFLNPQCLASISRWITASSSWKRFCLFVCRALSSIMVICMLTAIRLLLTFVMSLYLLLRS